MTAPLTPADLARLRIPLSALAREASGDPTLSCHHWRGRWEIDDPSSETTLLGCDWTEGEAWAAVLFALAGGLEGGGA